MPEKMMPAVLTPCGRGSGADALAVADGETGAGHRHPYTGSGSMKSSVWPLGGVLTLQRWRLSKHALGYGRGRWRPQRLTRSTN